MLLGTGLSFVGVALAGTARADDPGSGFGSFALSGSAAGILLTEDNANATGHPEAEAAIPDAEATLQSGPIGHALSSVAWPGSLVGNLGTLILVAGGPSAPQQLATLNDPVRAEAKNGSGTVSNTSVPGTTMTATVKSDQASADGEIGGADQAGLVTVGSVRSSAKAQLTGAKQATASAYASIQDITVAGVLHIGAISSQATAITDGEHGTAKGAATAEGATVAGIPVTIDSSGIHLASASGPSLAQTLAQETVTKALGVAGVTVTAVGPVDTSSGPNADYTTGAIEVVWKPATSNNETVTIELGGATVSAHANPGFAYVAPPAGSSGPPLAKRSVPPPASSPPTAQPSETTVIPGPAASVGAMPAPPPSIAGPAPSVAPTALATPSLPAPSGLPVGWIVFALAVSGALGAGILLRLPRDRDHPTCPLATQG
ncbi:hypothetical protein [Humibacter sp.]|uniref:hypothetical protein n=1 Tax=Humibacter sp. TaxID=1940291 RepID=UPI002CE43126|nr:hypothetical protein [Humibacter sp.]HVX09184.1 hypothetical protein [Humibacter sp.]